MLNLLTSLHFISLANSTPSVEQVKSSSPFAYDITGFSHFFVPASVPSSALIVPNPLHGAVALYEDNAEPGTWRVEYSMYDSSKAEASVEGTFSA